jgi:DNA-binding XRE family transcriptional regulator
VKNDTQGGTIYAIGIEGMPGVKIGCTGFPIAQRFAQVQTSHPSSVSLRARVDVASHLRAIELLIHRLLKEERIRGEWFALEMTQAQLEGLLLRASALLVEEMKRPPVGCDYFPGAMTERQLAHERRKMALRTLPSLDDPDSMYWARLGRRIRIERVRLDISQRTLAQRARVQEKTISQLELGKQGGISLATLMALADALDNLSLDYLMYGQMPRRMGSEA